jgi:hypothetical protein
MRSVELATDQPPARSLPAHPVGGRTART